MYCGKSRSGLPASGHTGTGVVTADGVAYGSSDVTHGTTGIADGDRKSVV